MPGVLALLAHPDDEIFCGGLLAALSRRGVPVHLAFWTRGEGGMSPKRRALWSCLPRAWHGRAREARRSGEVLGAASLTFLEAIDPAPDPELSAPTQPVAVFSRNVRREVEAHRPELLLTHGSSGDYGHPAHVRLHQLARELAVDFSACPLVSFNATWSGAPAARFLNANDPADFVFDSLPYFRKKIGIMRAHASQRGAFMAMAERGGVRELLRLGRYEGYRCWGSEEVRTLSLEKLKVWTARASDTTGASSLGQKEPKSFRQTGVDG